MKKLFFTLALALGALTVSAQEAGSMWVGGSVGFSSSKVKGLDSQVSYKILPEFGYILSDNLAVGINVGYGHSEGLEAGDDLVSALFSETAMPEADKFIVAPFLRYTFLKGSVGALFVDGGVGYTHTKFKMGEAGDVKLDQFEVGFRPGVAFNVSERVALTGKFGFLGYEHGKVKEGGKIDTFGFNFDLSNILIGASLKF